MQTLTLQRRIRPGASNKTEVSFLDLVVTGASLYDDLSRRGYDYVSCLGWLPGSYDQEARARLRLEGPGNLPDGRCALFICPECGDLGCGAISASISLADDLVIWSDFGYQNNYEDGYVPEEGLGPFEFRAPNYFKVLGSTPTTPSD